MDYKIADLNNNDYDKLKKVENLLNDETNKNYVLIAWEKTP